MPVDEAHVKEIKGLLNAAKQAPINFGLCLGAKPETDTLLMHRNKAAKALSMEAKAQAKGTKFAMGIATVVGSTLNLACEEKPPTGLAKRTKVMLKAMKLNMKVKLVGADGEVYEEDGEEEEGDAPAQGKPAEDPSQAEWAAMRSRLETDVLAFLSAGAGDVSRVRASWSMATEAADQQDFAGAVKIGTRLAQLMSGAPAAPAAPPPPSEAQAKPDAAALAKLLAALAPRIPAAAGDDAERRAALLKLATQANVYLKTNNLNYAANTIEELRSAIEGGSPKPPPAPPTPPKPADGAALTKQLAALIPRVAGVADAARKAELGKMAQMSNVYLKTNNWNSAATTIAELARALDGLSATGAANPPKDKAIFEKAGKDWLMARQAIEDQMEELRATIGMSYEGQDAAGAIDSSYRNRIAPVMRTLDASLAVKLAAIGKAAADAQPQLTGEAKAILDGYKAFAADPLLADLDDNPFVPLSIRKTLETVFGQVSAAVV